MDCGADPRNAAPPLWVCRSDSRSWAIFPAQRPARAGAMPRVVATAMTSTTDAERRVTSCKPALPQSIREKRRRILNRGVPQYGGGRSISITSDQTAACHQERFSAEDRAGESVCEPHWLCVFSQGCDEGERRGDRPPIERPTANRRGAARRRRLGGRRPRDPRTCSVRSGQRLTRPSGRPRSRARRHPPTEDDGGHDRSIKQCLKDQRLNGPRSSICARAARLIARASMRARANQTFSCRGRFPSESPKLKRLGNMAPR